MFRMTVPICLTCFVVLPGFVWGISLGDAWVEVEAAEVEEQVAFEALA